MIKGLKVENYKSFKNSQSLIFDAASNVYLVYGKNSSGKTNLYKLFKDISSIVNDYNFFGSFNFKDNNNIFCKEEQNNIFKLSIVFESDGVEYGYVIHVDYTHGPLYELLQTNDEVVYELDDETIKSKYIGDSLMERVKTFDLRKTSLLAILFNENIAKEATKGFDFKTLKSSFEYIFKAEGLFVDKYLLDEEFKSNYLERTIKEIIAVDFGIDGFTIENNVPLFKGDFFETIKELDIEKDELKNRLKDYLDKNSNHVEFFSHRKGIRLNYMYESRGTKLYIDYISTFIYEYYVNKRRTFIFDELDSALSSALVKRLIMFFKSNFTDAQLIFSTHNTNLLSVNEELELGKGNYIIVDKKNYESELYRLNSFEKLRDDNRNNFEKMYLNGRLGGIHEFNG